MAGMLAPGDCERSARQPSQLARPESAPAEPGAQLQRIQYCNRSWERFAALVVGDMPDARVSFRGADGTELVGTLSTRDDRLGDVAAAAAAAAAAASQCIILLHGGMGHRDYLYHKQLTRYILSSDWARAHGVAVFRFDYNGNGDSGGQRFFLAGFWDDVADIRAAMRALLAPPFRLTTVGLIGHSLGAQHVLQLAASSSPLPQPSLSPPPPTDPLIPIPPLLVCVQPRFRLQFWVEEHRRQCASSADGRWTMKWSSRGQQRSHVITQEDVEAWVRAHARTQPV